MHLASTHKIHQLVVVPNGPLEERASTRYMAEWVGRKQMSNCPFPGCPGKLSSAYMLHHHFRDLHPKDFVKVSGEGLFFWCKRCVMQCNPLYLRHINLQVCQLGAE